MDSPMRRKEDRAIVKHTINLYLGDYERLQAFYGTRIGAAKIIRDLVHAHIRRIEERTAQETAGKLILELDLEEANL